MKKDQVCVANVKFDADAGWTKDQLAKMIGETGLKLAASNGLVQNEVPGQKVQQWAALVSYRARGANTDDIERRFEQAFGRRPHAALVGTFQL